MGHMSPRRPILTALIALLLCADAAMSQYYLGVIRGEARKIPLAVLDVSDDAGAPALRAQTIEILLADLARSQIFEVIDPKKLGLEHSAKTEPHADLIKRGGVFGLTGVAWARLYMKGDKLALSGSLFDAASGIRMMNAEYHGSKDTLRRVVHSLSDDIVRQYTGEKGVAKSRIAFVSDMTGHKELFTMDYDGHNPMKISADHSICLSPAWSPDGRMLAYTSYKDRNPDLFGIDLDTGRRWKIAGYEGLNISPSWSPNGKRIAAALSRDGSAEVYLMNKEGKDIERLTYGAYDNVSPSWSPNGRELVFTSGRGGTPQLYIMGVDGTDVRRITYEGSYNASPQWSPRGDRIVFASQVAGVFKIATINPDGSDFRVLTKGRGSDENPSWSPSGRQLVFSSNREGKWNIYIMNSDGTDVERITPNDANYTSPAWSP